MIKDYDYYNFIDNNKNISTCQKKILKIFHKKINTFYIPKTSNKQILTYLINADKDESIVKLSKMVLLLQKFTSYKNAISLVNLIKNNKLTDTEIINKIKESTNNNKNYNKDNYKNSFYDVNSVCASWKYILENIALTCNKLFQNINMKEIKYLDIGCGGGNKTTLFSNLLQLDKKNVYGTDIKQWGPYEQTKIKYNFNFKFIKDNGNLDYSDNSFDFVTCFLMLHHVENLDKLLKEIKRILKPGGVILIIEHDCKEDYDHMIIDILHTLYEFIVDKNYNSINDPSYSQYYNWSEWDYIFNKYEFSFLKSNYIFTNVDNDSRYDNIYYAIYNSL